MSFPIIVHSIELAVKKRTIMSSSLHLRVPSTPFCSDYSDVLVLRGRNSFRKSRIFAHFALTLSYCKDLITLALYTGEDLLQMSQSTFLKPQPTGKNKIKWILTVSEFSYCKHIFTFCIKY